MDYYIIPSSLNSLEAFSIQNNKFESLNLAQQGLKYNLNVRKNHKGALRNMQMDI